MVNTYIAYLNLTGCRFDVDYQVSRPCKPELNNGKTTARLQRRPQTSQLAAKELGEIFSGVVNVLFQYI